MAKVTDKKIERLVETMGVSKARAKEALEKADGNLLDAALLLERRGASSDWDGTAKTWKSASTRDANFAYKKESYQDERTQAEDAFRKFGAFCARAVQGGCNNYFEIWKGGRMRVHFPIILFLLFLIPWILWPVLVILFVGFICGWRYRFNGPNIKMGGGFDSGDKNDGE